MPQTTTVGHLKVLLAAAADAKSNCALLDLLHHPQHSLSAATAPPCLARAGWGKAG
jgi:hypothetical protein